MVISNVFNRAVLSELNRRYQLFVESLPSRLATLATDPKTVIGEGSFVASQTVVEVSGLTPLPWAFCETFPKVDQQQLLSVGEAWLLFMIACFLRDHLADGQVASTPETLELHQRLMSQVHSLLDPLVGNNSLFWRHFEQYEQEAEVALQLEEQYRSLPEKKYDLAIAWQIGAGKAAGLKMAPCALAVLSGNLSVLPALERSIDAFAAGRQLLDDVADWQEDLARGHVTYPLAQAISLLAVSGSHISPQAIESELLRSTIREEMLRQATAWHEQAIAAVDGISCQGWLEIVRGSLMECVQCHRWLIIVNIAQAIREQGKQEQAGKQGEAGQETKRT